MTQTEALQNHRRLCEEIFALALEENRFLRERRQVPETALLDRKRALLEQLEAGLAALREAPPGTPGDPARRELIEKSREKILQILHLDQENEQLLLRHALQRPVISPATAPEGSPPVNAAPSQLRRIYQRLS